MSAPNWPASLALLLKSEGGNDDDPLDHGGRTSRGVTQREYDAWRRLKGRVTRDVWVASDDEIAAIYREQYWNPYCDGLPIGLDYLYFDMAVNAGPHRAAILLQRALGVTADGRIGPITLETLSKANPTVLIAAFSTAKEQFYRSLHQPRFIKGWLNRVAATRASSLKMVNA